MRPIEFKGHNAVYAKDQPEYIPLPVYRQPDDPKGNVLSCWKLTFKERAKMFFTGKLYLSQWTFNQALQPIRPSVDNPIL